MRREIKQFGLLMVCGLMSCQKANPAGGSSNLKTEVSGLPNGIQYALGSGFFSKTGTFLNTSCIKPSEATAAIDVIPYPEGKLTGGFSESRKTILDKFSMAVSASVNAGVLSGGGSSSIDVTFAESELKTSSYLSYTYRAGNVYLRKPELSLEGKGLRDGANADRIRATCGDELIYRVDLGARFHVGIEYTFASKELKDEMKAQLKINGPGGTNVFKMNESRSGELMDKTVGTLNLVVYQEGGDQAAFKTLADGIPRNCSLTLKGGQLTRDGFAACADYYQDTIIPYMKTQLPKQLGKLEYTGKGGLNVLRYYTKRYDEFGYPELQTEIDMPLKARIYKIATIDAFDRDLFQAAAFLRSINLGIGGNPAVYRPKELTVEPESFAQALRGIRKMIDDGQLGLNRCRSLLEKYVVTKGDGRELDEFMEPCSQDYKSFKDSRFEIIKSGLIPSIYKSYLD